MKVFVYRKEKPFKRISVIEDVISVQYLPEDSRIIIVSRTIGTMEFDTRYIKTSIFQN